MTDTRSLPVLRRVPHHKVSPGSAMRSLVDGSVVLRLLDGTGAVAPSSRSKARDGLPWSNADQTPREVLAEGLTEAEILELLPLGPADAAAWLARRLKSRGVEVGGRALGRDMPIGAVAGYDSKPVELAIWRAGGPQYVTSMTGGMHPDRGGSCFGDFGAGDKWRVYALGVDPDALPRAAIEAAAGGLRREGLALVGDRVQKVEAPAQVGATVESAAELLRLPLGALLVDSSGDPVIRRRDGTAHWCDLYPYSRCADYTWEGGGSEGDIEDALAWPLRILALGRTEITVENAAALARSSEVGRLRSEGLPAFAGPDAPARSVVEVWGKDEVAIRFPSGGWLPEGAGPTRVDSDDLWEWDLEAPAIVLAGNLSDSELLEVAAKDSSAAAREWCEERKRRGSAGAPPAGDGGGPLPGQVVDGCEVRPGSLALRESGSIIARFPDGRGWNLGSDLETSDARRVLAGTAEGWIWGDAIGSARLLLLARDLSAADFRDRAKLEAALRSPRVEADMLLRDLPRGCLARHGRGDTYLAHDSRGGWWLATTSDRESFVRGDRWPWGARTGDEARGRLVAAGLDFRSMTRPELDALLDGAPQVPAAVKVGDEVTGDRLPPGGVLQFKDGRFCARRADSLVWWFGPNAAYPADNDGHALVEGKAQWWAGLGRGDRGKVVALGASDADLCDPSWLRRTLGAPAGCAWAIRVGDEIGLRDLPPGAIALHSNALTYRRYLTRNAAGRGWWFTDLDEGSGRRLAERDAAWWEWPENVDSAERGRVLALGVDFDRVDAATLRRLIAEPRAEVAGPRLVSPAEAPRGWLLLDSAGDAAWVRLADGTGRLVRHAGAWLGLSGRGWSWPDGGPQPNHKPQPEARLRPLLELPRDGGQTPEAAHAIRAALWRESPPKEALELAAEALALAAGALGPLARGRVADIGGADALLLVAVPAAEVGDRVAAWTPAGLVFGDAATVAAVAALYLAKLVAHGDRCASALDSLAGLPGDRVGALRDLLTGTDRRVEWTCGGLSCAVSRSEWRASGVLCSPGGSPRPPQVAAGLVDHLLDQAGRRVQAGATRRGEGVRAWVARAELGDLAPSRCGPAVAPPGEATVCAVGPSFGAARSAEGLALAQVARVLRVGRRAGVVRSECAEPCAIAVDGVERHARAAVAALDAAGLLP